MTVDEGREGSVILDPNLTPSTGLRLPLERGRIAKNIEGSRLQLTMFLYQFDWDNRFV
jgi:hypothetical protein